MKKIAFLFLMIPIAWAPDALYGQRPPSRKDYPADRKEQQQQRTETRGDRDRTVRYPDDTEVRQQRRSEETTRSYPSRKRSDGSVDRNRRDEEDSGYRRRSGSDDDDYGYRRRSGDNDDYEYRKRRDGGGDDRYRSGRVRDRLGDVIFGGVYRESGSSKAKCGVPGCQHPGKHEGLHKKQGRKVRPVRY